MLRARSSIGVMLIQLALVSLLAVHYVYERWTCPRVWTRTVAVDPELVVRGRYLSLQLQVDGCPTQLEQIEPENSVGHSLFQGHLSSIEFAAELKAENGRLKAVRLIHPERPSSGQRVEGWIGDKCDALVLREPVNFFLSEDAVDPSQLKAGQELWVEVTVPPVGPPRPIQLALKDNGRWTPLGFE